MTTATLAPELTGIDAIDPAHSRIGFVSRHAMVTKVRGAVTEVEVTGDLAIRGATPLGGDRRSIPADRGGAPGDCPAR